MSLGISAVGWGALAAGGAAVYSASKSGNTPSGTATTTTTDTRDPRAAGMLYGTGATKLKDGVTPTYDDQGKPTNPASDYGAPDTGLLGQYQALGQQPQMAGSAAYGQAAQNYLQNGAQGDLAGLHAATNGLLGSNIAAPQAQSAQSQAAINGAAPQAQAAINGAVPGAVAAQAGPATLVSSATLNGPGAYATGNMVSAPAQNSVNTADAYNNMINGDAGANPYLTKALQSGVDQTNASYAANQTAATNNLMRNVLPAVRSNSILAGQYGGSRQGIAEGNAIGDFNTAQSNANLQLGLANSANTTGQQAAAFNSGQDRALSAMNTLSGQQYGVAQQDAATKNAAENMNVANTVANQQQQAGLQQQANLANQGAMNTNSLANLGTAQATNMANLGSYLTTAQGNQAAQQQTNMGNLGANLTTAQANQTAQQQTNMGNAALQQQTSLTNAGLQGQNNSLNSNNQQAGINAGGNLLNNQVGAAQNQDQYALARAGQVNGLLSPYLGTNGNTVSQPLYSNTAGNVLGGATAGLGLASQLKGLLGNGSNGVGSSGSYASNDYLTS